ncbi:predicted protein [Naegleria gruberi]|uniref:Predicted protein n=1 Tax=Naegleria gruberi TaxID=5762 RepID=D2VDC2_NAEGR|nr:uncharacterized protein NAEGRDRAFT_66792 [Naegleria gruberi]EFC45206.1 predicted protein [Naegleria gruberi]|eukprot:XP_002677950.1 predicted protein [Naegleria gruberi strain NEG-M]
MESQDQVYTPPPKPTFDQYIQLSQYEIEQHKNPVCVPLLAAHGFFKTFFVLDKYFESFSENPKKLHFLFCCHSKSLYSVMREKLDSADENLDENQVIELRVNLERMKQFLQFMYRADVECERGSDIVEKLKFEQNVDSFESDDELMQFVFEHGLELFDSERTKLKQVLLDVIQHYTVVHRSLNYRFDFEILLGFFRLIFERNGYIAPARSDPGQAAQDAVGETDLYNELLVECGLTL